MRIELICVGTELLEGKLNTNSAFVGERLSVLGRGLSAVATVSDRQEDIEAALRRALERSRIVIVTGGLGPTFDDLTREAAEKVLGRTLVYQGEIFAAIEQRFIDRKVAMPQNNRRQAYVLEGAKILQNALGTAPGQLVETENAGKEKTLVFLLPGPPREMQPLFEKEVFPRLRAFESGIRKSFVLHVAGEAESIVDEKIRPVVEAEREAGTVDFTILANPSVIDVKASVSGADEMLIDETVANLKKELRDILGESVFGEGRQTLESVVGELFMKHRRTLAVAESCTGGLLAQKITSVPGSSLYFREGAVTYANEAKKDLLGVKEETLSAHGAVSEETALEMAAGMKRISGVDYAVSITGVAGPSGGTPEKPVGLVFIACSGPKGQQAYRSRFPGGRGEIRERAAVQALDILRRRIIADHAPAVPQKPSGKRPRKP